MDVWSYVWMCVVGAVWGTTNPLLRAGSRIVEQQRPTQDLSPSLFRPLIDLWRLLRCWRFSLPLILNQTASLAFVGLVAHLPVSVVVPMVNSLQFLFTALVGSALGESRLDFKAWLGVTLVLSGIALMIYAG